MRILNPTTAAGAADPLEGAALLAGGTDLLDRMRNGIAAPAALVRIHGVAALADVEHRGTEALIGGARPLHAIVDDALLESGARALHEAAFHTATPQIRALASIGGALCQDVRCIYYRHADYRCRRRGGALCHAQAGDNAMHGLFMNDVCCAVHPSSVGAALLALEATLFVRAPDEAAKPLTMAAFFDVDGRDARRDNTLPPGALVEAIAVPLSGSALQGYERASSQRFADWADVEAAVVLSRRGDVVERARVVLGGVGRVPHRARSVEDALVGQRLTHAVAEQAAAHAADGSRPLAHNGHKVAQAAGVLRAILARWAS